MMRTIIDLWDGNISPSEHCGVHDGEADHLLSLMERNREKLCEGFCLGSKLTMEAASGC